MPAGAPGWLFYPRRVHLAALSASEQRVLGCLLEKRWTTPDQYPLTLNALRLACNQATNRDPVLALDESTVRQAAQRLARYGLARLASGHSSRATKYRHLAEEALGLGREELAVLCVLLLRGPQTPGELNARVERMAPLDSLEAVQRVLDALGARGYARRLPRRPGQKEDRFEHLLGGGESDEAPGAPAATGPPMTASPMTAPPMTVPPVSAPPVTVPAGRPAAATEDTPAASDDEPLRRRVEALEREVAGLREELHALRASP